jgi:hypothetical protein
MRLMPSVEPECSCVLQRKAGTVTLFTVGQSVLSRPVCRGRIAKYGQVRLFLGKGRRNLYTSDCVAERKGFEPLVQVLARTTV